MRKILIAFVFLVLSLLLLSGCATTIANINADPDSYLGQKVTVEGAVSAPIKLGALSGFTLKQDGASIIVSTNTLPDEKTSVKVKGIVMQGMMMPPYIKASDVIITD